MDVEIAVGNDVCAVGFTLVEIVAVVVDERIDILVGSERTLHELIADSVCLCLSVIHTVGRSELHACRGGFLVRRVACTVVCQLEVHTG